MEQSETGNDGKNVEQFMLVNNAIKILAGAVRGMWHAEWCWYIPATNGGWKWTKQEKDIDKCHEPEANCVRCDIHQAGSMEHPDVDLSFGQPSWGIDIQEYKQTIPKRLW